MLSITPSVRVLVVGLRNSAKKFERTRHNVGAHLLKGFA